MGDEEKLERCKGRQRWSDVTAMQEETKYIKTTGEQGEKVVEDIWQLHNCHSAKIVTLSLFTLFLQIRREQWNFQTTELLITFLVQTAEVFYKLLQTNSERSTHGSAEQGRSEIIC